MKALCWSLAVLSLLGCRTVDDASSAVKIVGAEPMTADNPGNRNAVALVGSGGAVFCSGALIAPRLVLTAAHCFQRRPEKVRFESLDSGAPVHVDVQAYEAHPDYTTGANFDVGWVRLAEDAPSGFSPLPILADPSRLAVGVRVVQVGYGTTGEGLQDSGHKLTTSSKVFQYIDHAHARGLLFTGLLPGRGTCYGDSGGPAYVQVDGRWQIAGALNGLSFTFVFGDPERQYHCEDGADVYAAPGRHRAWLTASSGVNFGADAIPEAWGDDEVQHDTFRAWCEDPRPPKRAWLTLQTILTAARTLDCAEAEARFAEIGSRSIGPNDPSDLRPLLALGRIDYLRFTDVEDYAPYAPLIRGAKRIKATLTFLPPELLTSATELTHLEFGLPRPGVSLGDLSWISSLTRLTHLTLQGLKIRDIAPLAPLTHLVELNLSDNEVADLTPLARMSALDTLEIHRNQVRDLTPLRHASRLTFFHASDNRVEDVAPLAVLPLKMINLAGNQVHDVSILAGMGTLVHLDVFNNPLAEGTRCPIPEDRGDCRMGRSLTPDDFITP